MAKRYVTLGNVTKSKDGKSRYIKVNINPKDGAVTLKNGDYINLNDFEGQIAQAQAAVADGNPNAEARLEATMKRIEKDKEFGAFAQATLSSEE